MGQPCLPPERTNTAASQSCLAGPPAPFGTWRGGRRAVAFGMPATCAPAGRCPQPTRAATTPAGSGTGLAAAVVGLSQYCPPKGCVRHSTRGWVDFPTAPPRKRTRHGPPPWRGSDGWCKPPSAFVSRLAVAAWLTPAEPSHPRWRTREKKKLLYNILLLFFLLYIIFKYIKVLNFILLYMDLEKLFRENK